MLYATTTKTPARTDNGMSFALAGEKHNYKQHYVYNSCDRSTSAVLTLVAVRAIAPVAGNTSKHSASDSGYTTSYKLGIAAMAASYHTIGYDRR